MTETIAGGLPRVYCAGPLFNQAERDEMTAIADALEAAGFAVFLPHRDGMEFRLVHQVLVSRGRSSEAAGQLVHSAIFALDVYQLAVECGAMVWNLNGRVPDEGAVSEAAIAWTLGKPLVAFADDARSLIEGRHNPLLVGLVDFRVVNAIDEIAPALRSAVAEQPSIEPKLVPKLRATIETGRALWSALDAGQGRGDDERIADAIVELFENP